MQRADLVIVNGDIVTMDMHRPRVRALAVAAGRILALGSDADMRALAGPGCRIIDAGGRMVLPGLQDTHIHLQDSGQDYSQNADLTEAETPDQLVALLLAFATTHQRDWVLGTGWNSAAFGVWNLDRQLLDHAVPDRPCLIVASDGHNGCMNSAGLAAVGFGATTEDPVNGHIVRDGQGAPTGLLYETAVGLAEARMPVAGDDAFVAGVKWAAALANSHGLTGVLDAKVEERHVRVYRRLARADELTLRVAATALVTEKDTAQTAVERLSAFRADACEGLFRVHSAKFFFDGVIENRTAAMIAPYSDAQGGNAPVMFPPDQVAALFTALDAARFQIHVHAIGDMASRAALDGIAAARAANGSWPALHQIAHVQFLDPADIARFRPLGVMANIQPLWARHEAPVDDLSIPVVGPDRSRWLYAFQSLARAGAGLALSSDWGVSTLNPFAIMQTAVTRQPEAAPDTPPLLPQERLTRLQALQGYTLGAAAAAWRLDDTGSLSPGKQADLIVLDRDILTCPITELGQTRVFLTLLGGKEVFRGAF